MSASGQQFRPSSAHTILPDGYSHLHYQLSLCWIRWERTIVNRFNIPIKLHPVFLTYSLWTGCSPTLTFTLAVKSCRNQSLEFTQLLEFLFKRTSQRRTS